jgi:SAM-dependent methyltransferase
MVKPHQCSLCHGSVLKPLPRAAHFLGKPPGLLLYCCSSCNTVSAPDYDASYDADYYASYDDNCFGTDAYNLKQRMFREHLAYLTPSAGRGRLLDIGCGIGHFLDLAAQAGFTTYGAEYSRDGVLEAAQRGHTVVNAAAEALPFANASFDAIHMNHVLEHLHSPLLGLQTVRRLLKPGCLAVIEVPNEIGALPVRLKLMVGKLGVPGAPQERYAPHITYFTMRTLSHALDLAGLRIVHRFQRFAGSVTPALGTVPAMLARAYDKLVFGGQQIGVVVTRQ